MNQLQIKQFLITLNAIKLLFPSNLLYSFQFFFFLTNRFNLLFTIVFNFCFKF